MAESHYASVLTWLEFLGPPAWRFVGVALAGAIILSFAWLISDLLIPLIFAVILAAIFVPVVDRLERAHVPRAVGSPLVVVIILAVVAASAWVVIEGVLGVGSDLVDQVEAGVDEVGALVDASPGAVNDVMDVLKSVTGTIVNGILEGLGSLTVLIVGFVTGTFIMLYLMKDWTLVLNWTADTNTRLLGIDRDRIGGLLVEVVTVFRRYALGLTLIGIMNGVVVGGAAVLLDVPSAGAIAVVTFVTSYIPFFGAFFAGAFAVAIAIGAEGWTVGLAMLAVVLLANNALQNLLEPVAFGRTLHLHPLVVLLVTTGGTLLFGILGATLAAPLTAIIVRARDILREEAGPPDTPVGAGP